MSDTYSPNGKMALPSVGEENWNIEVIANYGILDGVNPAFDLFVTTHESPVSASLLFDVAPGIFIDQAGLVTSYAGSLSNAVAASSTTSVYLTNAGVLTLSTSGFPAAGAALYVPLAVIVSGATTITSITDWRAVFSVVGGPVLPAATATATYGTNEQTMLNAIYAVLRATGER